MQDHEYGLSESPRKLKSKLLESQEHIDRLKQQLKMSQQQSRRLKKRVTSLKKVVKHLRQKQLISSGGNKK